MMMEAPLAYPDSPTEDDVAYPCKGCGKILEEGKAFELAGNRWHIDCFRCNTCGTLLDSDANLLLLGDGSLICNNCTYSCSACGNKIEDLAILTGDHAFCASCFRCRNCKKQIENLRYARTSQGIFCMECHEGLMARRRKKSKSSSGRQKQSSNNMLLEKSLPSLPPGAVTQSAFTPGRETPPSDTLSETPTELPASQPKKSSKSRGAVRDRSPAVSDEDRRDNLTLPSTTYDNRHSSHSQRSNISTGDDYYIPVTLDPNPAPGPSPLTRHQNTDIQDPNKQTSRDYFSTKTPHSSRKVSQDQENSRPPSSKGNSQPGSPHTPHIAYQEKGREPTSEVLDSLRKRSASGALSALGNGTAVDKSREASPRNGTKDSEKFKLQEAPKRRKSGSSARNSRSEIISPSIDTSMGNTQSKSAPASANVNIREHPVTTTSNHSPKLLHSESTYMESTRLNQASRNAEDGTSSRSYSSPKTNQIQTLPQRGDSLQQSIPKQPPIARKEVAGIKFSSSPSGADGGYNHVPVASATSVGPQGSPKSSANINGGRVISGPIESPIAKSSSDFMQPPARAKDRPSIPGHTNSDSFVSPRPPPPPPMEVHSGHKGKNESISTLQSTESTRNGDAPASPNLPRYSAGGEFSMAEDMARILGPEEQDQDQASFLRRVSNSVRHARSYSDRGTRLSREQKWPKSPLNGTASGRFTPTTSSPEAREDIGYMTELRALRQMNMEKDREIAELKIALDGKANIHHLNSELRKKRSTMVVLDTQKDLVIRELEVMTDHTEKAKRSIDRGEPLEVDTLTGEMLQDFKEQLDKLKDSFTPLIEDLREKKSNLSDEVAALVHQRDQVRLEFDQANSKNSQLTELNNQLVHQIQSMQAVLLQPRNQSLDAPVSTPQGLGIYTPHAKDKSNISMESHEYGSSSVTGSTLNLEHDAEPATILSAPQVVNIRKGQPKKFNWKKGQSGLKGVTKGLKGAFATTAPNNTNEFVKTQREGSITEGMPYGAMPQNYDPSTSQPAQPAKPDASRQGGFGFFSNTKPNKSHAKGAANGHTAGVVVEDPSVLFGSELEQRALYEHASIPGIVTRCIQEVETRGINTEGIYRKSGGASQIQVIKEGFESNADFDISDPDLDIAAVTSALKQYFRKLPTPLITYAVYDKLLDAASAPDETDRIALMRAAIKDLPPHHRTCLEFLVFHLSRVANRERENKMGSMNVAVVFAPTIMRPESLQRELVDTQAKNAAVTFLIEQCHAVFLPEGGSPSDRRV